MKKERLFEVVVAVLISKTSSGCRYGSFDEICSEEGIARVKADNLLYERLGMSGDEILEILTEGK